MKALDHELYLNRMHWPVTVLGHGNRVGIWFQGCSIRCAACCSQDTWDLHDSRSTTIGSILDWIDRQAGPVVDGITLSGGEPFDQPIALLRLLAALRDRYCHKRDTDILVYSGYSWRKLSRAHAEILRQVDALVSGPYVAGRPAVGLRGSDNQELHLLSDLARERYRPSTRDDPSPGAMQLHFDGRALWMIGIPQPGDLVRLSERLKSAGIDLQSVSWRA